MYSPVFEIWKCKENQFVSQVASAENHLAFVVAAVNRVINRTNPDPDPQTLRLNKAASETIRPTRFGYLHDGGPVSGPATQRMLLKNGARISPAP